MHIVWATDGSESAMAAADLIRDRFDDESIRISVLVVGRGPGVTRSASEERTRVDTIGSPALPLEFFDADEPARATPQLVLDEARQALEGVRAAVAYIRLSGRPVDALVDWLADEAPTVLVVGSSGRGRGERWLLGSVSSGVAFRAPCSVLVMRGTSAGAHALVGYDGSDDVEATFPVVPQMLGQDSVAKLLTIVRHRELFPASVRPHLVDSLVRASADRFLARQAHTRVEVAARALRAHGVSGVETSVVVGEPREELLREVRDARPALLVLGAAGQRGVRMYPGNITEHLLHGVECSVLIGRA